MKENNIIKDIEYHVSHIYILLEPIIDSYDDEGDFLSRAECLIDELVWCKVAVIDYRYEEIEKYLKEEWKDRISDVVSNDIFDNSVYSKGDLGVFSLLKHRIINVIDFRYEEIEK